MASNTKNEVTKKQVEHVAKLCALSLDSKEVQKFSKLLSDTLDYISVLEELDIDYIEPTYHVGGTTNVFQDEELVTTLSQDEALQNAHTKSRGLFVADAVFDRE